MHDEIEYLFERKGDDLSIATRDRTRETQRIKPLIRKCCGYQYIIAVAHIHQIFSNRLQLKWNYNNGSKERAPLTSMTAKGSSFIDRKSIYFERIISARNWYQAHFCSLNRHKFVSTTWQSLINCHLTPTLAILAFNFLSILFYSSYRSSCAIQLSPLNKLTFIQSIQNSVNRLFETISLLFVARMPK